MSSLSSDLNLNDLSPSEIRDRISDLISYRDDFERQNVVIRGRIRWLQAKLDTPRKSSATWRGREIPSRLWKQIYDSAYRDRLSLEEFLNNNMTVRRLNRIGISNAEIPDLYNNLTEVRFESFDSQEIQREIDNLTSDLEENNKEIEHLQDEIDELRERLKRPPYMLIEFTRFWQVDDEYTGGKNKSPKIRFEVRAQITVPTSQLTLERQETALGSTRWLVRDIESRTIRYLNDVFWDVIKTWDRGNQIHFSFYRESSVIDGMEPLRAVTAFVSNPDFYIVKYKNGAEVKTWGPITHYIDEDAIS